MNRLQLEKEVLHRLHLKRAVDIPIMKRAIKLKPTADLEKILEKMNAEGY